MFKKNTPKSYLMKERNCSLNCLTREIWPCLVEIKADILAGTEEPLSAAPSLSLSYLLQSCLKTQLTQVCCGRRREQS